ncbi:GDNF family receptor alpha-like [Rhineura floridana]|uniref:GDNF family receptor alpha-like n=1 Tax=Rhineura floridana TaxID=261503 RepID=UPI002AC8187B|nr:GDNF family receptor alpha-like [Rhineura floridana]
MNTILLMVLGLHSVHMSAFQTSKCQELRDRCTAAEYGCRSVWNLLEEVCCISGNSYTVKDSTNCNKIIQFLVDQFPEFKDCICTKDNCSIKMLLGKQCFSDKGKSEPTSSTDVQLKFLPWTTSPEMAHPRTLGIDCAVAKEICRGDDTCSLRYKKFQRVCRTEVAKCSLRMVVQQCFTAWKELSKTVLGNCTCPEPVHKRCTKIWKNIFNNTCLQHIQEYRASVVHKETNTGESTYGFDADNLKIKSEWKVSALSNYEYKHLRSCFQVNMDCVNDEVCNRQLSLYLRVCQANGTQCNLNHCQAALQSFYENMPFNIALMLTFCDCLQLDENCHQAKGFLHGKPCGGNIVPPPSCLSVIHMCQGNHICWAKYEAFTLTCLKLFPRACLEDKACLEILDTNDLICSDSAECRAAYIGMWGSVLRVECTCDTTPLAEQPVCKRFYNILHSKSCFTQISGGKADLYSSHIDLSGKILPVTGERSLFYDDTVVIIIYISCIILVLGIILLTLLKTRACTTVYQAKTASPAHLSEKLMISQQPWIIKCVDNAFSGSSH